MANTFEIAEDAKVAEKVDPTKAVSQYRGAHLFVMCHGFQGSSFDMRTFKNIISLALPDAMFLCSTANEEGLTEGSIFEMGERLANEVI